MEEGRTKCWQTCSEANQRIATKYLLNKSTNQRGSLGPKIAQQHSSKEETDSNIHPRRRQRNMKLCWSLVTILLTLEIIVEGLLLVLCLYLTAHSFVFCGISESAVK